MKVEIDKLILRKELKGKDIPLSAQHLDKKLRILTYSELSLSVNFTKVCDPRSLT